MKKLWLAIIVLAILTPMGLILPALFKTGAAWGEWSPEEVEEMVGFLPEGMKKLEALWEAPIPDYSLPGTGESLGRLSIGYIISAFVGIIIVMALMYGITRCVVKEENDAS